MAMDKGKIVDGIRIINNMNPREVVIFNFQNYLAIVMRAHELDYPWAMILVHGGLLAQGDK